MRGARQPLKRCDLLRSLVLNNKYSDDHKKPFSLNAAGSPSPSLPTIATSIIMSSPGCTHIPEEHNPSFLSAEDDESDPTTYSVFPQVSNRHPPCVQFRIEVGSINMKGRHHEKWIAVSDSVWPEAMVESRPETIRVNIVVFWSEHAHRQY
jgi:hypothetical protein